MDYFPIQNLSERKISRTKIFNETYRNDKYVIGEYLEDFLYYEMTPLKEIEFDDKHSVPWQYFSLDGLNYLLPRIIYLIQLEIDDLSISLLDFIINMTINESLALLISNLNRYDLSIIESVIENIIFETNDEIVSAIGEHYLFLDLEFIQAQKNNYDLLLPS